MDGESAASPSIDQVVKLLVGPDSRDLVVRHTHAINQLCARNADGFYVRELSKLRTIMEVTINAVKQGQIDFEAPMELLLRCCLPLWRPARTYIRPRA